MGEPSIARHSQPERCRQNHQESIIYQTVYGRLRSHGVRQSTAVGGRSVCHGVRRDSCRWSEYHGVQCTEGQLSVYGGVVQCTDGVRRRCTVYGGVRQGVQSVYHGVRQGVQSVYHGVQQCTAGSTVGVQQVYGSVRQGTVGVPRCTAVYGWCTAVCTTAPAPVGMVSYTLLVSSAGLRLV